MYQVANINCNISAVIFSGNIKPLKKSNFPENGTHVRILILIGTC